MPLLGELEKEDVSDAAAFNAVHGPSSSVRSLVCSPSRFRNQCESATEVPGLGAYLKEGGRPRRRRCRSSRQMSPPLLPMTVAVAAKSDGVASVAPHSPYLAYLLNETAARSRGTTHETTNDHGGG